MFPDIEAQQRSQSRTYGVASVRFFGDMQFFVFIHRQPCPAGAEQADCRCIEFFLEVLKAAEVTFDGFCQFPGGFERIAGNTMYGSALARHY